MAEEPLKWKGRKNEPQRTTLSKFERALTLEQGRLTEGVCVGR